MNVRRIGAGHKVVELDAGDARKRPTQLEALAVVAAETDRQDRPTPSATRLFRIVPAPPGLAANAHHIMDRQARLDRGFRSCRVDLQIAVEAEIADDRDPETGYREVIA